MAYFVRCTSMAHGFVCPLEISKGETMTQRRKPKENSRDVQNKVSRSEKYIQKRIRKPVPLYMGDAMKEQLEKMARDHDLSKGAAIRTMIREGLKARGYGMILD